MAFFRLDGCRTRARSTLLLTSSTTGASSAVRADAAPHRRAALVFVQRALDQVGMRSRSWFGSATKRSHDRGEHPVTASQRRRQRIAGVQLTRRPPDPPRPLPLDQATSQAGIERAIAEHRAGSPEYRSRQDSYRAVRTARTANRFPTESRCAPGSREPAAKRLKGQPRSRSLSLIRPRVAFDRAPAEPSATRSSIPEPAFRAHRMTGGVRRKRAAPGRAVVLDRQTGKVNSRDVPCVSLII